MMSYSRYIFFMFAFFVIIHSGIAQNTEQFIKISESDLKDKIHGGLLGQILGNLNGLPHEMKYIDKPGNVEDYTPSLPDGARTDDDTDIEWVYVYGMQQANKIFLSPEEITNLWKAHINQRIWCSNEYARQLMDIGIHPPYTGNPILNPWADFNISGQFLCESFGLIAPGMPQTAARIGVHYTQVGIDGEPAQTTQMFTSMIAEAYFTHDLNELMDTGLAAIDPQSVIRQIVNDVRQWYAEYPDNWRMTRRWVKEKYSKYNGEMRDRNGYELNTASTIAALLYGQGDFVNTLKTAFNFGWDADNNAATAATIIGVIKGYNWMEQQGWEIKDVYRNTTRDQMPEDETISGFAERLFSLAKQVIIDNGGSTTQLDGKTFYQFNREKAIAIKPLVNVDENLKTLQYNFSIQLERDLSSASPNQSKAKMAYIAICIDMAEKLMNDNPQEWQQALRALKQYKGLMEVLFQSPTPAAVALRSKAKNSGLSRE